ncbi:MAG: hypothetical protein ACJ780_20460 [Solirubrobacteraceae bacterium]
MRKLLYAALVSAIGVFAAIAPAANADSPWTPVDNEPFAYPAAPAPGSKCSFDLGVSVVINQQQSRKTPVGPPAPAGTTQTEYRGELVYTFTNQNTGAAVTMGVGGPYTEVDYPDGSGGQTGAGNQFWGLGPHSRANTGLPGALITTGKVAMQFDTNHVITELQAAKVTNLCTLLGGYSA